MAANRGDRIFRIRARDRLIGEKLDSQAIPENIKGKPLKIPQFNFTISLENKVKSLFGPPYYAKRAGQIENITQKLMEDLTIEYASMIDSLGDDPEVFAQQWTDLIGSLELDELNDLIDKHNTYYPMEAKLQIDPNTGAPLLGSVPWKPKERISVEGLLKRFPPDMNAAYNHDEE